jgi:hypothetical protein
MAGRGHSRQHAKGPENDLQQSVAELGTANYVRLMCADLCGGHVRFVRR